jgi:peptide-methionine (S)-S-oxide reductase
MNFNFGTLFLAAMLSASTLMGADLPDPLLDSPKSLKGKQTAVFAGGCFWCTEAVFELIRGVDTVISGYAGGDKKSAHYKMVGEGITGHAESIQINYDASKISYGQLLKIFFGSAHDPTQLNRQGPDYGKQYRSAIFYVNEEQKKIAEAYIAQLNDAHVFKGKIATVVSALPEFYPAEDYHQDFVKLNPEHPYVVVNSVPKVQKTKAMFRDWIKK